MVPGFVRSMARGARGLIQASLRVVGLELRRARHNYAEVTPQERAVMKRFSVYTMTPEARQWSMLQAIEYVDRCQIPGAIVECGVWRGGLMMLAKAAGSTPRDFYLFDTFDGMPPPEAVDTAPDGTPAAAQYRPGWCRASLDEVRDNFRRHGLLDDRVIFRKGPVEETLKAFPLPEAIAVLRLDTDWYASTKIELEKLYPRLSPGGVLIIDDYGSWMGQKRAVDEYFGGRLPLLTPIDWAARVAIRSG